MHICHIRNQVTGNVSQSHCHAKMVRYSYSYILVLSLPAAESPSQTLADLADSEWNCNRSRGSIEALSHPTINWGPDSQEGDWFEPCGETNALKLPAAWHRSLGPRGPGLIQVTKGLFHSLCSWIYDQMTWRLRSPAVICGWLFVGLSCRCKGKCGQEYFQSGAEIPSGYVQIQLRGRLEP